MELFAIPGSDGSYEKFSLEEVVRLIHKMRRLGWTYDEIRAGDVKIASKGPAMNVGPIE